MRISVAIYQLNRKFVAQTQISGFPTFVELDPSCNVVLLS